MRQKLVLVLAVLLATAIGLGSWQVVVLRSDVAHLRSGERTVAGAALVVTRAVERLQTKVNADERELGALSSEAASAKAAGGLTGTYAVVTAGELDALSARLSSAESTIQCLQVALSGGAAWGSFSC